MRLHEDFLTKAHNSRFEANGPEMYCTLFGDTIISYTVDVTDPSDGQFGTRDLIIEGGAKLRFHS